MSEAELHVIRARLTGGMLNKARRGELALRLPAGFVRKTDGKVDLDPDKEVQSAIRKFFEVFRRNGSVLGAVRRFSEEKLLFPTRMHAGPDAGELVWRTLTVSRAAQVLHNPCYAGAYAYGRRQTVRRVTVGRAPVRIVASSLEADWNQRLRDLRDAEDDYLRRQAVEIAVIDDKMQERIRQLSSNFADV